LNADTLVRLVLGPTWAPAAPLAAVLAPLGLLHAYFQLNTAALIGVGAIRTQLRLSALTSVLGLAGILAGLPWGIQGVAVGYAAATVAASGPSFYYALRGLEAPWTRVASGIGRSWAASGVMLVALVARGHLAPAHGPVLDLMETVAVGAAAYVIALLGLELLRPAYLAPRPRRVAVV
jgi:PST family polysaccharide transporter